MEKLLFIDACMRGHEQSRTYKLVMDFLQAVQDKFVIETVDLNKLQLDYLNEKRCLLREQLIADGDLQHAEFDLAGQFAAADKIVVAAPFWDLNIPAALKVYLENIAAVDIAFKYTDNGEVQGLCRADKLLFIATCGGVYSGTQLAHLEMATPYMRALCTMFGIKEFASVIVEGLDIYGADVQSILTQARVQILSKAEGF